MKLSNLNKIKKNWNNFIKHKVGVGLSIERYTNIYFLQKL